MSLSAFVCSVMVVVAFVIPLLFLTAVAIDQFLALGASLQQMFTDETGLKAGRRCGRPTSGSVTVWDSMPPQSWRGSDRTRAS